MLGQGGDDALDGGDGRDELNGGRGTDDCVNGETISGCETAGGGTTPALAGAAVAFDVNADRAKLRSQLLAAGQAAHHDHHRQTS